MKPDNKSFNDLTSKKYGKLTVISYQGCMHPEKRNKRHLWLCLCECGKEVIVATPNLITSHKPTRSCGCLQRESTNARFEDLTGEKFGILTVIEYVCNKCGHTYWKCKCECGKEKNISSQSLKRGFTKSCGCRRKFANFKHGLSKKPGYRAYLRSRPSERLKHNISVAIRKVLKDTKKRARVFDFLPYTAEQLKSHLENLWETWMNWNNYGGKTNDGKMTWHIDHIIPQSKFTFTNMNDPQFSECWNLSNLRPLEKIANIKKGNS